MSEVQEGLVKKVYANDGAKGGCTVYLEGVDGGLYCNKPYKAEDFPVGVVVEYVVKKPAGKGYAIEKIRVKPDQPREQQSPAATPSVPATSSSAKAEAPTSAASHVVRSSVSADQERQRMIVMQSCQKVAVDMLKIYMEKEAFTLGAAVNKRKAVIDAFYNGLVYDLYTQVVNGVVPLEGRPEDAKPIPKAKKTAAVATPADPTEEGLADIGDDSDELP